MSPRREAKIRAKAEKARAEIKAESVKNEDSNPEEQEINADLGEAAAESEAER